MAHHPQLGSPAAILRGVLPRWSLAGWEYVARGDGPRRRTAVRRFRWPHQEDESAAPWDTKGAAVDALRAWRAGVMAHAGLVDVEAHGRWLPLLRLPAGAPRAAAPSPLRDRLLRDACILDEATRLAIGDRIVIRLEFLLGLGWPLDRLTRPECRSFEMEGDIPDDLFSRPGFDAAVKEAAAGWLRDQAAFAGCRNVRLAVEIEGLSGHERMRYKHLAQA